MTSICPQNIVTRTGQPVEKVWGQSYSTGSRFRLPLREGFLLSWRLRLEPLDTPTDGIDLRPAVCQREYLCLSRTERTREVLLHRCCWHWPSSRSQRGGCTPFASLKFSDTALRGLSSSCSSRMRGSPVGKSSGAGFGSCGEERRPVGLHAAGARCPGCWESNGKNMHGAGT